MRLKSRDRRRGKAEDHAPTHVPAPNIHCHRGSFPATPRLSCHGSICTTASPQQQIAEIERRLQPFYNGDDPNSLRDDKVFQDLAEEVHHSLTEALNAGRPENERVIIPMPRIFVFQARQAKVAAIPARDHNGDIQYAMARSQNCQIHF
jgi:hypothetical protein